MPDLKTRRGGLPPRVAARPDPGQWLDDELMTLREAASLHWPQGPLTARSLRTAAEAGQLPVTMVARKLLTTRRALKEMSRCAVRTAPGTDRPQSRAPPEGREDPHEAAYGRLMRILGDRTA